VARRFECWRISVCRRSPPRGSGILDTAPRIVELDGRRMARRTGAVTVDDLPTDRS